MKLRTILIIVGAIILGFSVVSNIKSFKRLSQTAAKTKMQTKNIAYKDLFADTSRFSNTSTFYSDVSRDSIGGYVVDKTYNLVLYKASNLKLSDTSLAKGFSFVKSQEIERSNDVIYDGSYRTEFYRFYLALNTSKLIKHLKIHYDGEIIGNPLFTPTSIKINMTNLNGLAALTDDEKQVEFSINKYGLFSKAFALQIVVFKREGSIYFAALSNRNDLKKPIEENILEGLLKN
ncbi:MAG: hypothetical protein WC622_12905 [Pedobacter sp.]|jgi:hypothetical protein|uniref:hypothetical protein n=1 Tax=Pedobacter sp. TaxID=1411316 RepID=UPI003568A402